MNWRKVRDERRFKIIAVSTQDVEEFLMIHKLPDTRVMSTFDFPETWTVYEAFYEPMRRGFSFVVMSPEFDQVPIGAMPETIAADRHTIKITRKAVSA